MHGLSPKRLAGPSADVPPGIYGEWKVPGARRTLVLYALACGRPRALTLAMSATAFVPLAIGVLLPGLAAPFTAAFTARWLLAAWLFRRAGG